MKVLSVTQVGGRSTMLRCQIADETGVSNAFLPDHNDIQVDGSVVLFKAQAAVVKEHIEIQLERGGRVEKARKRVEKVNDDYDLSFKA